MKLPKRAAGIVDECRRGAKLCRYLHKKRGGETEVRWFLFPSGRTCSAIYAHAAISSGHLQPQRDDLFGDEFSQTWAHKRPSTGGYPRA
jgi:hypothetical protein